MSDYDLLLAEFRVTPVELTAGARDALEYAEQTRAHAASARARARAYAGTSAHADLAEYAAAAGKQALRAEAQAAAWLRTEVSHG